MPQKWVFCAKVDLPDDGDSAREVDATDGMESQDMEMENPLADEKPSAPKPAPKNMVDEMEAKAAKPAPKKLSKKQAKAAKKNPQMFKAVDLLYTNTGAMDIIFGSDSDSGTTWIKDVKSSRLQPGMKLVSMEVFDREQKKMVTRNFDGMPFNEVVKEVEAQNKGGTEGGISPFHLRFDPDPDAPSVETLETAKLVRMEAKHEKEVIDALEAIDRGTERAGQGLAEYRNEKHEQEKAKLSLAEANVVKLQGRITTMEREKARAFKLQNENTRRLQAQVREESAASAECRSQLRDQEDMLAKVNQDLKTEQASQEKLTKDFATQSGQLEAARVREVASHDAQAQMAKNMMDAMDGGGDAAAQLKTQLDAMTEQKKADDKEIEGKTVELRESADVALQAGQREENARNELGAKIEKLESIIAGLNASSQRQQETHKLERAAATDTRDGQESEIVSLQLEVDKWEVKYNTLRSQHQQVKMVVSLATSEIQGLKDQRMLIQQELDTQLKEQAADSAKAAAEAQKMQKDVELAAAELKNQEKMAKKDSKKAADTEKFQLKQLQGSISDKITQVEGLNDLVKSLQDELKSQRQLRTEQEAEVTRINKTAAAELKSGADLKAETSGLKHKIWEKGEEAKKAAAENAKLKEKTTGLTAQLDQQSKDQQAQLEDERNRANTAESMRTAAEKQIKLVSNELLAAKRTADNITAQHNTALSQIASLERRYTLQNAASKVSSGVTDDKMKSFTKAVAVDAVEIDKLKADYKEVHTFLIGALEDLRTARVELEGLNRRTAYQDQEFATSKTMYEKKNKELTATLAASQANEKGVAGKLAAVGQKHQEGAEKLGKEALTARTNEAKVSELGALQSKTDAALKKAEDRVSVLEVVGEQANVKVMETLRAVAGLEEKLRGSERKILDLRELVKSQTKLLRAEEVAHKVTKSELGTSGASLAVALAIQPALDKASRELEKTQADFAQATELATAAALAAGLAAAATLKGDKDKATDDFKTMQDTLQARLDETNARTTNDFATMKDDLTSQLKALEAKSLDEFTTMKDGLTAELAETKTTMAAAHKKTGDDLTAALKATETKAAADLKVITDKLTSENAAQKQALTAENAKNTEAATKKLAETQAKLDAEHKQTKEATTAELQNTKATSDKAHAATKEELANTTKDLKDQLATTKADAAAELDRVTKADGAELSSVSKDLKAKLDNEKKRAADELKKVSGDLTEQLEDTKKSWADEVAKTKKYVKDATDTAAKDADTAFKKLEADTSAALADEQKGRADDNKASDDRLKADLKQQKEKLDTEHTSTDDKLTTQLKEKDQQLKDEHKNAVDAMSKDTDTKVQALSDELEKCKASLGEAQAQAKEVLDSKKALTETLAADEKKMELVADAKEKLKQQRDQIKALTARSNSLQSSLDKEIAARKTDKQSAADAKAKASAAAGNAKKKLDADMQKKFDAAAREADLKYKKLEVVSETAKTNATERTDTKNAQLQADSKSKLDQLKTSTDAKYAKLKGDTDAKAAAAKKAADAKFTILQNDTDAAKASAQKQTDGAYSKLQADKNTAKDAAKKDADFAFQELEARTAAATTAAQKEADTKFSTLKKSTDDDAAAAEARFQKLKAEAENAKNTAKKNADDKHGKTQADLEGIGSKATTDADIRYNMTVKDAESKMTKATAAADAKYQTLLSESEAAKTAAKKATDLAFKQLDVDKDAAFTTAQKAADAKFLKLQKDTDRFKDVEKKKTDAAFAKLTTDTDNAKEAAKKASDDAYSKLTAQNEAAKVAAKKASDAAFATAAAAALASAAALAQTHGDVNAKQLAECKKLSEAVAAAQSAEAEANKTITAKDVEVKAINDNVRFAEIESKKQITAKEADTVSVTAEYEEKCKGLEAAANAVQAKLNESEATLASTKGLHESETQARKTAEEKSDDDVEKLAQEIQSHNETKDMVKSQLEDSAQTIDRYASEKVQDQAERDGLQDKLKDMERERMRIYARLAETQMVLLSKNKALLDATSSSRRYRIAASMKAAAADSASSAEKKKEADKIRATMEADLERRELEIQEMSEENMKMQRVADDQEMQMKQLRTDLDTAAKVKVQLDVQISDLDNQCGVWRAKVRHRHRALEMPEFKKDRSGQADKKKWLEERALAESLGFDADNNKEVEVSFDQPPPLGLGVLNAKDHAGDTYTVVHTIKEVRRLYTLSVRQLCSLPQRDLDQTDCCVLLQGSPVDVCPQVVAGQVVVSVNGEEMSGRSVHEVVEALHVRPFAATDASLASVHLRSSHPYSDGSVPSCVRPSAFTACGAADEAGPAAWVAGAAANCLPRPHAQARRGAEEGKGGQEVEEEIATSSAVHVP